jgi:predicted ATPase
MNERLIVKNFLCLEDIDIEVKDFLILIGPQAAGKSLCAKLLYFLKMIFEEAVFYYMKNSFDSQSDFTIILADKFESLFPKTYWVKQSFHIEYRNWTNFSFKITKEEHRELSVHLDKEFLGVIQKLTLQFNDLEHVKLISKMLADKYINTLSSRNVFIPAGRSFFSLLQKNMFRFLRTNNNIDPFIMDFGIFYEDIKQTDHDIPAEAQALIHAILKGDYIPAENLVQLADGSKITLELLSSGQQEALPLALVFAYITSLYLNFHSFTNIYVEEPETHLFPDAQEQMSRLISFLQHHNARHEVTFAITTHSPYILASFNNLIKAGNIVKQNPALKNAVCDVIPESMHIDIERFSAYSLENGKATSIIDEETSLIDPRAIDGVSDGIMEIFNTLQDIESDNNKDYENV